MKAQNQVFVRFIKEFFLVCGELLLTVGVMVFTLNFAIKLLERLA